MSEVRERVVLPVAIPVGILIGMGVLVVGFAQVLLNVPGEVAIAIALLTAVNLLGVFTVLALRPALGAVGGLGILVVLGAPIAVGAAAALGVIPVEEPKEEAKPVVVEVAAQNIAFDKKELHLAADGKATIRFANNDVGTPHNIVIVEGTAPGGKQVFQGELFNGKATKTYSFDTPAPGSYYFYCAVHPNMSGTVIVEAQGEGGGKPVSKALAITANNIRFDKSELTLPSSGQVSIKFTNGEPVPHNISFFRGADASGENVFRGDIVTGPVSKQYTFAAPGPGEYYFQCDVHPTMKGRASST